MSERRKHLLIVGGDSRIGAALRSSCEAECLKVVTTTRRPENVDGKTCKLDLLESPESWRFPENVESAVIAASVTDINVCRGNLEASQAVNVEAVVGVAQRLLDNGTFVVFLSTNQVFDGSIPFRRPEDTVCPVTQYGQQKAEAERRILGLGSDVAIVRMTKVLEDGFPLLKQWADTLRQGKPIQPFRDAGIAPIPLSCPVSVIRFVCRRRAAGVFHVSADRDIAYADIGLKLAGEMGIPGTQVQPLSWRDSENVQEAMPAHTTLDVERLRAEFGMQPPDVEWTLDRAIRQAA